MMSATVNGGSSFRESQMREEVCKKCWYLYCKTSQSQSSSIKVPDVVDPNHWCCNYWILVKPMRRKTVNQEKRAHFRIILKYLRAKACLPNVLSVTRKCSRPHVFLQRNLQSCKKAWQSTYRRRSQEEDGSKGTSKELKVNTEKKLNRSWRCSRRDPYVFKLDTYSLAKETSAQAKDTIKERLREDSKRTVVLAKRKTKNQDEGAEQKRPMPRLSTSGVSNVGSVSLSKQPNDAANIRWARLSRLNHGNFQEDSLSNIAVSYVEELSTDSLFTMVVDESEEEKSELLEDEDSNPFPWKL